MISTGIRAQLGVKILGDNLDALQKKAFEVERIVRRVPGATGVAPSRVQGKPISKSKSIARPWRALVCRRRTCWRPWRPALGGKKCDHHDRRPRALSDPGAAGTKRARRSYSTQRRAGLDARAEESFRSDKSPRFIAWKVRAKSRVKTGGSAFLFRPMCRIATSAASSRK